MAARLGRRYKNDSLDLSFAKSGNTGAARIVFAGASILAGSVLADSTMEHYRGTFHNPAMVLPLASSMLAIAVNARPASTGNAGAILSRISNGAAAVIGLAGFGFHVFNIGRQPGGYILNNFLYKAPLGAPGALVLAGVLGAAAERLAGGKNRLGPVEVRSGKALGALSAFGLVGTVAEAGFLHFRGAYHNPAMWLPVAVPPLAALSLARDVLQASPRGVSVCLLGATAVLGFAGTAFHAYGISRNMGGWRNWRQNVLVGPPLPAPPSFTGLAIAGIGALLIMRRWKDG